MKKIILTVAFLVLAVPASSQTFVDTTLTTPLSVTDPVVTLRQYSFYWMPDSFVVNYNLLAADGSIVEQRVCTLTGADFTTGDTAVIVANKVGATYKSVIAAYLQAKCKGQWELTGTE